MTDDPETLADIHAAAFTTPHPWSADEIAQTLATAGTFLLSAPDGFLIGRIIAGEAELLTVAVRACARRKGTGARLVAGFLAQAAARDTETAFLEVAADNGAAIALYSKAGFARIGRRRGYYRPPTGGEIDAIIMSRRLGDFPRPS